MYERPANFHLEISGLDAFALFCAIIRDHDLNTDAIIKLTHDLRLSNKALQEATDSADSPQQ